MFFNDAMKETRVAQGLRNLKIIFIAALLIASGAHAHDAHRPHLNGWFDQLKSGLGPCCSHADGVVITESEWKSQDGHYLVLLGGVWMPVPDSAVLKQPNLDGRTIVWPTRRSHGDARDFIGPTPPYSEADWYVRCFILGALS